MAAVGAAVAYAAPDALATAAARRVLVAEPRPRVPAMARRREQALQAQEFQRVALASVSAWLERARGSSRPTSAPWRLPLAGVPHAVGRRRFPAGSHAV